MKNLPEYIKTVIVDTDELNQSDYEEGDGFEVIEYYEFPEEDTVEIELGWMEEME
jgi:hypothetical protein